MDDDKFKRPVSKRLKIKESVKREEIESIMYLLSKKDQRLKAYNRVLRFKEFDKYAYLITSLILRNIIEDKIIDKIVYKILEKSIKDEECYFLIEEASKVLVYMEYYTLQEFIVKKIPKINFKEKFSLDFC